MKQLLFFQNEPSYRKNAALANVPKFFTKSPTFFVSSPNVYEKFLPFPAEIQFFIKLSSVHVKCTFDDCAETFELNMEEIHTEIPKLMRKFEIVGKKPQNGAPELENSVLSTVNKQGCAWSKYFPLSVPKLYEKLSSFEKLFFFKMIVRTGQMQLWQTCRTLPPKSDTFYRKIQMLRQKILHTSVEIQFSLECSPVHVKCTFDNSAWNFQLNMETIRTKIPKKMRKFEIVGKNSQSSALELKIAVLSTVQKQGCH